MNTPRKLIAGGALALSSITAGAFGASLIGTAGAQTPTTTAPAASSSDSSSSTQSSTPAHGTAAHEALETAVSGDNASKAQAAAVASVGGTAGAVTTDSHGGGYEVQVTKADGTQTEVHLDSNFAVAAGGHGGGKGGPHSANGITETVLTGDDAAKATAAAQAAAPGATIDRVETDADGATYEAHITKADGTKATVEMDANFTVTNVKAGK